MIIDIIDFGEPLTFWWFSPFAIQLYPILLGNTTKLIGTPQFAAPLFRSFRRSAQVVTAFLSN
jgi:hypothetical protein